MEKQKEKVVFIDRDGVINKFPGHGEYVLDKEELMVFGFVPDALRKLKNAGFSIFLISNQACVSKGLLTEEKLKEITSYMLSLIEKQEQLIDGVYYCVRQDQDNSPYRKPEPGLIKEVFKEKKIRKEDFENTPFFIGDSIRDVKTAKNAGIKSILVLSGKASLEERDSWEVEPDYICKDLQEASDVVIKNGSKEKEQKLT